jgi:hypothetical protein
MGLNRLRYGAMAAVVAVAGLMQAQSAKNGETTARTGQG